MHRIFAYGTLLNPARQKSLFGRRIPNVPASVAGWRKVVCVGPYYGIVRERGARTDGGVMELTRAELSAADAWEGVPSSYRRTRVRVKVSGRTCLCWAYVPAQGQHGGRAL